MKPSQVLVASLVGLAGIACSASDSGAPPVPSQFALVVQLTDGVSGSPAFGSSLQTDGTVVSYQFALATGYRDLEVRLDDQVVASIGTVRMDKAHELKVTAFPIPPSTTTPEMATMQNIYASRSPVATAAMLKEVMSASLAGDTQRATRYTRAEAFVLEQLGPDAFRALPVALAGSSMLLAGDSTAPPSASRSSMSLTDPTFPTDTIVPTTVIFINGILNLTGGASGSALALATLLTNSGFGTATFVRQPGSARQAASMRVYLHFNPIVALQNPVTECVSTLAWAFTVANGETADGSRPSVWLRVEAIFDKYTKVTKVCTDPAWFSTNVRALDQFLTANASLLSPPDANDRALISLVEQERALAGGRNVWLIGHSQGAMIARDAVSQTSVGGTNTGCLATFAIASPLSNKLPWPGSDASDAVTQKGSVEGSEDLFYDVLGAGADRTDGQPSQLTNTLDDDLRNNRVWWPILRRLELHHFVESYLAPSGLRTTLGDRTRQLYARVGAACSGSLEGVVGDISTRLPIVGAKVQPTLSGTPSGNATTTQTGGIFRTPPLFPVLHDLIITAPGYDTVKLGQRLVPFRGRGIAQGGMILMGKACIDANLCKMQGTYDISYQLSGTIGSIAVACAFDSHVSIKQADSTFVGTITTDRFQEGCDNGLGAYVFWQQGTSSLSGVQRGRDIVFTHDAVPPWQMTGRIFDGGFAAVEPLWKIADPQFILRVELTATRTSTASIVAVGGSNSNKASSGPQPGIRR
jgi:hypothetical protein